MPTMRHAVIHTLTNICQGGIYDHLGGGFARYSVDALWLVPHFEKMLYDNAQLLALLADVSADTRSPLLAARARETVGWLEREMLVEGAFASSLDADSEGEEGKYYVWQAAEIDRVLGADAAAFRLAYGVTDGGNWEGQYGAEPPASAGLLAPDQEAALRASADRLLAVRAERVPPGRDDKVLADWNGLMIAALAKASAVFDEPALARSAPRPPSPSSPCDMMPHGRLAHSWRGGRTPRSRLSRGLRADGRRSARPVRAHRPSRPIAIRPRRWMRVLDEDYLDAEHGGYFQVPARRLRPPGATPRTRRTGRLPSGNGLLVAVLCPALLPDRRCRLARTRRAPDRRVLGRGGAQPARPRRLAERRHAARAPGPGGGDRRARRARTSQPFAAPRWLRRCPRRWCSRLRRTRSCRPTIRPSAKAPSTAAPPPMSARVRPAWHR